MWFIREPRNVYTCLDRTRTFSLFVKIDDPALVRESLMSTFFVGHLPRRWLCVLVDAAANTSTTRVRYGGEKMRGSG